MSNVDVQSLWDHQQIQHKLATYCRGIDRCDAQVLKSAYWPDAYEDHGLFQGKAWDFADFIVPLLKGMRLTIHQISNVFIELDGAKANVETYVMAYHLMDDPQKGAVELIVGGRYLDKFERRAQEWRIADRLFVLDWNQTQPATGDWNSGLVAQLKTRGSHDGNDPSYGYFRAPG
jgi:hypothetical protein